MVYPPLAVETVMFVPAMIGITPMTVVFVPLITAAGPIPPVTPTATAPLPLRATETGPVPLTTTV
jgi:hypothetical protein